MAAFDMKKLSTLDKVVAGSAVLAFVAMFLPWYGVSVVGFSESVSGFSSGWGWIGALMIVAAGVYLTMLRSGRTMPTMRYGPGVLVLGLSGIGTLLVALRWITMPRGGGSSLGYSYGPQFGMWLTLLAGVVQVVGALRLFRSSGESVPWASKS